MTTKIISVVVGILAVLGAVAFFGYSSFLKTIVQQFGSPVGTTFNTAKIVAVNMSPATAAASSTSILNTDASARWVANYGMAACTGVATAGTSVSIFNVQAATTSVANQGLQGNTNVAINLNIATSSSFVNASTSTPSTAIGSYWAAGTYMTFLFNTTNAAACTVEMDYLGS